MPREGPEGQGLRPLQRAFRGAPGMGPAPAVILASHKSLQASKPVLMPVLAGLSRAEDLRRIPEKVRVASWSRVADGYLARIDVSSPGALGLRVGLRIEGLAPGTFDVRSGSLAAGMADELPPAAFPDEALAWTAYSLGDTQAIEVFSRIEPKGAVVSVQGLSHFVVDPLAAPTASPEKLLSCQQNYSCSTDANVTSAGRAVAKLIITVSGVSYVCSGALLNDRDGSGTPWFATASHCGINSAQVAASLQFLWFYEQACGSSTTVPQFTTTVGSQLLLDDPDTDFTFLRVTGTLPSGLFLLGWSSADLVAGTPIFGVHHPRGSQKKYSLGTFGGLQSVSFRADVNEPLKTISSNEVTWTTGITEPGSSGSPLLTGTGQFRGALSAGPLSVTCTARDAYYSRFANAYYLVRQWIDPTVAVADDFPDSAGETLAAQPTPYESVTLNGAINSATDEDWMRFRFSEPGMWVLYTSDLSGSTTNLMGEIHGPDGTLISRRDANHTRADGRNSVFYVHVLGATTLYARYLGVGGSTGNYKVTSRYYLDDDHSDIVWLGDALGVNSSASGAISRSGDADYFIIDVPGPGTLTLASTGSTDVVGYLYDSNLNLVTSNDDQASDNHNFRISRSLQPGRYYLGVLGYDVTTLGTYGLTSTFTTSSTPLSASAKVLGSRATVTPSATLYGGFEIASAGQVYILVRGNSLGTLGVTQAYLDAPRVRVFNSKGEDIILDLGGRPGFNNCSSSNTFSAPVVAYYQNVRGQPVNARDACGTQVFPAGAYTFSVAPSVAGVNTGSTTSAPNAGEVLFEVTLGGGAGLVTKTLGSRATVSPTATQYGGFQLANAATVYIMVRGNSLGTLGVTQAFLDAPRVRIYNGQGQDIVMDTSGRAGFNTCLTTNTASAPVANYYQNVRGQAANTRDACIAQTLEPGAYTFSVTPSIPGVTSGSTTSAPSSGEVLFEVTLAP